jgi:hypothetical protein
VCFKLLFNNLLSESQCGFTAQKSTEDILIKIKEKIMNTFERKGFCLLFSLDISGAFNNAWPPYIIKSLKEKKCPSNLLFLSKSYFENRRAKLWFQNIQVLKDLNRGCPQ